jgi:uncharacterized damage-inducible protein DinB
MLTNDPLEILIAHDRWATQQMIDACAKVAEQQFRQPFEMGPGSLHNTLIHILSAKRLWTQILAGQQPTPRLDQDGQQRTAAQINQIFGEVEKAYVAEVRRRPLEETVSRTRDGKTTVLPRGAVFSHVVTHGMHHRAQMLNMLRRLNIKPLPPSSVFEWSRGMYAQPG